MSRECIGFFRLQSRVRTADYGNAHRRLRLFRDWNHCEHKLRRADVPLLIERDASVCAIIRYIRTGDSGNIPQYGAKR